MDSSSDPEKDSHNRQSNSDNPFIKFRQFADSQISSVLQGIIGLPSALSRSPHSTTWTDFDEDMRRRDDLKRRQTELEKTTSKALNEDRDSDHNPGPDDSFPREIPLYSPSQTIFAYALREDCYTHGLESWRNIAPLHTLQGHFQRHLQMSDMLQSQYSLLPYLLLSAYSPIKLEMERKLYGHTIWGQPDRLNYTSAFQDLILTTQGRPMGSIAIKRDSEWGSGLEQSWIHRLWASGLLQQKSLTEDPAVAAYQRMINGADMKDALSLAAQLGSEESGTDLDAETELEAYERFLRRATSSAGIADVLESLFEDAESWINKHLDPSAHVKELTDLLEQKTGNDAEDVLCAKAAKVLGSLFGQGTGPRKPEDEQRLRQSFSETKIGRHLGEANRSAAPDQMEAVSERFAHADGSIETRMVISKGYASGEHSTTTTTQVTKKDGSAETTIEVQKGYADGRATTTKTTHREEPPCCNSENDITKATSTQQATSPDEAGAKGEKKTGWFWN